MKILVVEDEHKTGTYLRQGLSEAGFVVDLAGDGPDGLHMALTESYDLAILDVMLPGIDGWQVLAGIRRAGRELPVLFLSARDQVDDRVRGLELGADDYLVKPFAFDELLARLRALGRRGRSRHQSGMLRYGPIEVDPAAHTATVHGDRLSLSATEYRLLEFLVRRAESVITRDQLSQHVWGGETDPFSNVVDVYVGYVRRKLQALHAGSLIQTVRGLGYMLKDADA